MVEVKKVFVQAVRALPVLSLPRLFQSQNLAQYLEFHDDLMGMQLFPKTNLVLACACAFVLQRHTGRRDTS